MPTSLDEQIKNFMRAGVITDEKGRKVDRAGVCRVCGKLKPNIVVYTGKAQDVLCSECLKKYEGLAFLMCQSCGNFIGPYKTGITPEEKYEVKPGETLHLNCCPNCNPDAGKAFVVEFRDFMQQKLGNMPAPAGKGEGNELA